MFGRSAVGYATIDAPAAEAEDLVRRALHRLGESTTADVGHHQEAQTTSGGRSWGELVTVDLEPIGPKTAARVSSRSVIRATVIDWGKNASNVEKLTAVLASGQVPADRHPSEGSPVLPPVFRWVSLILALIGAVPALFSDLGGHRERLLLIALVAVALNVLALSTGAIRIRRRGQLTESWACALGMFLIYLFSFSAFAALRSKDASLLLTIALILDCEAAGVAAAALVQRPIIAIVRRRRAVSSRG